MTDSADLTATEAAALIRSGQLSSEALVAACNQRIEAREGDVQAWTYYDAELARSQALKADADLASGEKAGRLQGLPVGIKDIIATEDMPTEDGTPANKGRQPDADAVCVSLLRAEGAVIMGKTVTTELATRSPGKTRNPHNAAHTPGGSSSGSAAAVACGMVPLALGTQTGGSVIRPASFCGIFGMKPTRGMISRTGVTLQSHTLDTVGVYGRSVEDLALIADALCVADRSDDVSYPRPAPTFSSDLAEPRETAPRLSFMRTPAWEYADAPAQEAILGFVAGLGPLVSEVGAPASFDRIIDVHRCVQLSENVHHFREIETRARALLTPSLQSSLDEGRTIGAGDYVDAVLAREKMYADLLPLLDEADAIVCLPACGIAPKSLETTGSAIFNGMWTYLGVPCITVPLLTIDGMPLGVQLVGERREEGRLLRTAQWLWQACRP